MCLEELSLQLRIFTTTQAVTMIKRLKLEITQEKYCMCSDLSEFYLTFWV